MQAMAQRLLSGMDAMRRLDFLAPLALRLYLAPVFWQAGMSKWMNFSDTVAWFGDATHGLGLPLPWLMAALATAAELGGAVSLLLGVGVRWMCIPLLVTMGVAMATVHGANGWLAISEGMGPFATERTMQAVARLDEAKQILMQYGDYDRLTEFGPLVILNNGIEFAATYAIMLLTLFFIGAGRYVSIDHWVRQRIQS